MSDLLLTLWGGRVAVLSPSTRRPCLKIDSPRPMSSARSRRLTFHDASQGDRRGSDHDMRLTTTTNVSVDGVMQGLGGPDEDRRGGFDRGGWAPPLVDTETGDYLNQVYGGAAAFLFGRREERDFAGHLGGVNDPTHHPIGAAPKNPP